jgi:outer membrane cobalamin receptor
LIAALSLFLGAPPLAAQAAATISGVVTDTSGGVVADASVEAIVAGSVAAAATTGVDGRFQLSIPAQAGLALHIRRRGFADHVVEIPGATGSLTRDVTLSVGGVSDTLVVTATRSSASRAATTQSVSVVTRADLTALGSTSLADVLRFVPAVNIESSGREGAMSSMFARGGESDYNLVLIDGVRVNQSGGAFDFSRIGAAEIDRVEVVRGAQSSLWGSDAMGSVVQVFTKRAGAAGVDAAPRATGAIEAGSFGSWRADVGIAGGAQGRVDYNATVSGRQTDGAFADILPEDDSFEQTAVTLGAGLALGPRASLRTGLRYSDGTSRNVGPINYGSRDTGGVYEADDLSWHIDGAHAIGAWYTGTAAFNYFRYDSLSADTNADPEFGTYTILEGTRDAIFPNGPRLVRTIDVTEFLSLAGGGALPAPGQVLAAAISFDYPFDSASAFRRPGFRYQGDAVWGSGQRLSAGYEWERESNPLTDDPSLTNNAFFVQQQLTFRDRWFATVGGRVDSKESYDTFFSPKFSAGGFLLPFRSGAVSSLKVFGNIGKGIKSPTFYERFGGLYADGSPDLAVERARTADVGVEATFADERLRGSLVFFDNNYTDQVAYTGGFVGDGNPEYINIDGSEAHGWELELALQRPIGGLTASASYALVDSEVVTTISTSQQFQPGQPLLRRPRNSGAVRAAYALGRATINFNMRMVGQRHDNSFLFLSTVPNAERPTSFTTDITVNPGYVVAGLGVDWRFHDRLTAFVRGDNVGDREYESVLGYPGLPRAVVIGARFNVAMRP